MAVTAYLAGGSVDDARSMVMSEIVYPFVTSELVPVIIETAAALLNL